MRLFWVFFVSTGLVRFSLRFHHPEPFFLLCNVFYVILFKPILSHLNSLSLHWISIWQCHRFCIFGQSFGIVFISANLKFIFAPLALYCYYHLYFAHDAYSSSTSRYAMYKFERELRTEIHILNVHNNTNLSLYDHY